MIANTNGSGITVLRTIPPLGALRMKRRVALTDAAPYCKGEHVAEPRENVDQRGDSNNPYHAH